MKIAPANEKKAGRNMSGNRQQTERERAPVSRAMGRVLFGWRETALGPKRLKGLMEHEKVRRMFDTIASAYDLQNRFLAMWIDTHWRNMFVRYLRLKEGTVLGDLAIGTAEIAIRACRRYPGVRVVGIDFSPRMLRVARRKIGERRLRDRIELHVGDLRALPAGDAQFDAITISFGIRNIVERDRVLRECFRALKPGGKLQIMELGFPKIPIVGPAYRYYFDHIMPLYGNWLSGTDYAYTYLAETVYVFPSEERFIAEIRAAGFTRTSVVSLTYGMAKIYRGHKPRGGTPG